MIYAEGSGKLRKGWLEVCARRYFINDDYLIVTKESWYEKYGVQRLF